MPVWTSTLVIALSLFSKELPMAQNDGSVLYQEYDQDISWQLSHFLVAAAERSVWTIAVIVLGSDPDKYNEQFLTVRWEEEGCLWACVSSPWDTEGKFP